jgi:hypothetical protein
MANPAITQRVCTLARKIPSAPGRCYDLLDLAEMRRSSIDMLLASHQLHITSAYLVDDVILVGCLQ